MYIVVVKLISRYLMAVQRPNGTMYKRSLVLILQGFNSANLRKKERKTLGLLYHCRLYRCMLKRSCVDLITIWTRQRFQA
jgi:hypothetical protein